MWAWIGVFLAESFALRFSAIDSGLSAVYYANLATFAVVGVGAIGCLFGGLFADRLGRTTLTIAAMAVSGGCALVVGLLFGGSPWWLSALCLLWGLSIVADSAQFSSCTIELADPSYIGTMLTVQTCVGFMITIVTIHLMPYWVDWVGWRYAFAFLAVGPLLGMLAMWRLRLHPAAARLANGNR